mgnify:CR=1 FL=1
MPRLCWPSTTPSSPKLPAKTAENLHTLEHRFPAHKGKARLLLELNGGGEVPDPYYGGPQDFEAVYRLLEEALEAFLQTLQTA